LESIEQVRARFAQEIQKRSHIRSAGLIAGLAAVPREQFLGPGPWKLLRATGLARGYELTPDDDPRHLYQNVLVALDESRRLNNGEPAALLLFMDALDLAPGDRMLHVGCGVGYYTAVAAHAAGPQGHVLGVEIDPVLADRAARCLRSHPTVGVVQGDATTGHLGTFDAILVNAGCTRPLAAWLDQLAPGGRLVLPLTVTLPGSSGHGAGAMLRVAREESGYSARFTSPVAIFHCAGARSNEEEALLKSAFAGGDRAAVARLRRDEHAPEPDCWLHADSFCLQVDPALRRQKPAAIALPAARLANFAGRYQLAPTVVLTVTLAGDALAVELPGSPRALRLYPATPQQFFFEELNAQISFVSDEQGHVTGLLFEQEDSQLPALRLE
jgi:protein-L-isoaspartate(D-aspartate) O-methyltransferase